MLKVTDDTTRDDIAEALRHVCAYAERQPHVIGWSTWERAHERIDQLLTDYEQAPV